MRKVWVILLVALTLCLTVSGCTSPTPVPSTNNGPPGGTNTDPYGGYATATPAAGGYPAATVTPERSYSPSAADVEAGDSAVMDAASAIQFNDPAAFTALMSAETLSHVSGTPDLTTPEAQQIGEALQNAHMVRAEADAFVYEMTMGGVQISFMVIKEDGAWKILGL